jgi:hypothetical protein
MASTVAIGDRNHSQISRNFNVRLEDSLEERSGGGIWVYVRMEGRIRKDNLKGFGGKQFWRKHLEVNDETREEPIVLSTVLTVRFETETSPVQLISDIS